MHISRFTTRPNIKTMLYDAARRLAVVVSLAAVALISAPFVSLPQRESERIPQTEPPKTQSRIGVTLRSGDTLLGVLKRFGVERPSAHALLEKVRPLMNVRKIQPGNDVHVVLDDKKKTVEAVELVIDDNLVRVKATDDGWLAERQEIPFVRESRLVRGTINGNLYGAGIAAGLSPQQILELAQIFASDIDFFSDFHAGNQFSVIVEERRYIDGRRAVGRILAAELDAENDTFDAFYFPGHVHGGEYYNSNGEAMHRSFLRAPLSYARVSSPFSANRLDPVLRTVQPHLAIDYAAPAGTPVVAIGAGRVEFIGWQNGYGNVVDIRHSGDYTSRYAHFSRFAANLRRGQSVNAGDVIGYVGQTGHATGPHLHFEFLHGTTKINFLALRVSKIQQLTGDDWRRFTRLRDQQLAMLHPSSVAQSAQKSF
jgi:murein DD-endopeptidase MepM/ murein hydrolase activator NlpD